MTRRIDAKRSSINRLTPNRISAPLDTSNLQRIGVLGWMCEFEADLALGAVSLHA